MRVFCAVPCATGRKPLRPAAGGIRRLRKITPCRAIGATMRARNCARFALLPLKRFGYVAATPSSNCYTDHMPDSHATASVRGNAGAAAATDRMSTAEPGRDGATGPQITRAVTPPPSREAPPHDVGDHVPLHTPIPPGSEIELKLIVDTGKLDDFDGAPVIATHARN